MSADLQPMTDQDVQDWSAVIDAKAQADQARGVIRNGVINAGQAVTDLIIARRGRK